MDAMGILKVVGKLAWGVTKLTAKATAKTADLTYKGTKATAQVIYDHREQIGSIATTSIKIAAKVTVVTTEVAYKATSIAAEKIYDHREEIRGVAIGSLNGTTNAVRDASGHLVTKESINSQQQLIQNQSRRYHGLNLLFNERLRAGSQNKIVLLDTLVVGGETLAQYISSGHVPSDIQQAYELAYPNVAAARSFSAQVEHLDGQELIGFVSGVKGKLFELHYVDYLNEGNLPSGFHAELANSPTNPDWDIAIVGRDGLKHQMIQAKATDSVTYVKDALEKNPQIDVVTTSEVHSHLIMQGFSEHVIDGGISDSAVTAMVDGATEESTVSMHWIPSAVSLAIIAFSSYNVEGLSPYDKSRQFGERSSKSYLAYLAGGSIAVATNTWWLGMLGGMGSRLILDSGRQKRENLAHLKQLVKNNEIVLKQLEQLHY